MKKIYISPMTDTIKIATVQMIAASNPEDGFAYSKGKGNLDEEIVSGNMSRSSFWDED